MGIAASTSISTKSCGKEFTGFFTARGLHPSEGVGEPSENEIGSASASGGATAEELPFIPIIRSCISLPVRRGYNPTKQS